MDKIKYYSRSDAFFIVSVTLFIVSVTLFFGAYFGTSLEAKLLYGFIGLLISAFLVVFYNRFFGGEKKDYSKVVSILEFTTRIWDARFQGYTKAPLTLSYEPLLTIPELLSGLCHIAHRYYGYYEDLSE